MRKFEVNGFDAGEYSPCVVLVQFLCIDINGLIVHIALDEKVCESDQVGGKTRMNSSVNENACAHTSAQ